ncbi:MAG: polysaccharide deacetylase [Candidatus Aminicenantes bacterium]|nr:polysaccharide deacetylase [Candidatus Aminicenantes bacterium]MDH5383308.1 polysaccharide deacetylase [Candidatus Aminicenantes bacterium]
MKMFIFKGVCLSVLLVLTLSCTKTQEQEEKPWDWSLDDVKATVGKVRAGQDLTPESWPNGAKVAVALSFDFDAETNALRDMILSPGLFSQGEYAARVAIRRILALLDEYDISASFFVPAVTVLLHQDVMKAIVAKGRHEIGMHGWIHERNSLLSEEEERVLMQKSFDTLKEWTGRAPVGIRTPSWDFSLSTLNLIKELGLLYDSSLMADDRPYELLEDGKPSGIVELPVEWLLDDYPYFGFSRYSSIRPQIKPMDVLAIWAAEFEKACEEGTLFVLTMHPKYIGHRSRIVMLENLIQYIQSHENVWFATHEDIARYVKEGLQE